MHKTLDVAFYLAVFPPCITEIDRRAWHKHGVLTRLLQDHSDNPLGAAVTLAHELGHNFGMNHDTPERGCGCRVTADRGGCIMTPSTGWVTRHTLAAAHHSMHSSEAAFVLRGKKNYPKWTVHSLIQLDKSLSQSPCCWSTLSPFWKSVFCGYIAVKTAGQWVYGGSDSWCWCSSGHLSHSEQKCGVSETVHHPKSPFFFRVLQTISNIERWRAFPVTVQK